MESDFLNRQRVKLERGIDKNILVQVWSVVILLGLYLESCTEEDIKYFRLWSGMYDSIVGILSSFVLLYDSVESFCTTWIVVGRTFVHFWSLNSYILVRIKRSPSCRFRRELLPTIKISYFSLVPKERNFSFLRFFTWLVSKVCSWSNSTRHNLVVYKYDSVVAFDLLNSHLTK